MNGVDLFLLGRTLMKIGEAALPTEGVGRHSTSVRTVLVVLSDVCEQPRSAVGEIAVRTGLPQSAVSGAIARLREAGAVTTVRDVHDGRRQLVEPARHASERVSAVRATAIEPALASALDSDDPSLVAEVTALLEKLATYLTPGALGRLHR